MECEGQTIVSYVCFGVINLFSFISCGMFAFLYYTDTKLSASPGKLIASMELCQGLIQLTYFTGLPVLRPYLKEEMSYLCTIVALVQLPLVYMAWAYAICINLEVLMKVQRASVIGTNVPYWVYHLFVVMIGAIRYVLYIFVGSSQCTISSGCTYVFEGVYLYL